jgi:hypothetical protein
MHPNRVQACDRDVVLDLLDARLVAAYAALFNVMDDIDAHFAEAQKNLPEWMHRPTMIRPEF